MVGEVCQSGVGRLREGAPVGYSHPALCGAVVACLLPYICADVLPAHAACACRCRTFLPLPSHVTQDPCLTPASSLPVLPPRAWLRYSGAGAAAAQAVQDGCRCVHAVHVQHMFHINTRVMMSQGACVVVHLDAAGMQSL